MILKLTHRDDFDLVRRLGEMRRSGPLGARVVPTSVPVEDIRVGYAISRRFGTAVKRNRMRRRLRHSVAQAVSEGPVLASHALFDAAPPALTIGHADLVDHCRTILTRPLDCGERSAAEALEP